MSHGFYEKGRQILPSHHNKALYVITSVYYVELKRAMVDRGYSLNIMPLSMLEVVGIPESKIIDQSIEILGFGGNVPFTLSYTNLDLTMGPIRVVPRFHDIDARTSYHLLLESPGSINTRLYSPRTNSVSRPYGKTKKVYVSASESTFQRDEAYFSEASSFMN